MTRVAVVVPAWNTSELLAKCLGALGRSSIAAEIVVVDNASDDGSADMVARDFPEIKLIRNPRNEGFARACNQGSAATRAPLVLFLNSDTQVEPEVLAQLAEFLERNEDYAAAAPRLLNFDGSTQRACMDFPRLATALWFGTPFERWFPGSRELRRYFARDFDYGQDGDVLQPPAAALMLRRSVLDSLGGFDERMWLFFNDVDLSRRLWDCGERTRYLHGASVLHVGGASTAKFSSFVERWHYDRLAYYRKHHGWLAGPWVKLCASIAWADFVLANRRRRAGGSAAIPQFLGPTTRAFLRYLVHG